MSLNIALGFDHNFIRHAAVTVTSLLEHVSESVTFYMMCDDSVTAKEQQRFEEILKRCPPNDKTGSEHMIKWISMKKEFGNLYVGCWSQAMYYPLALPEVCPENRILFLDADTLVLSDLVSFYHQDLTGFYLAAAHDFPVDIWTKYDKYIHDDKGGRILLSDYFIRTRGWNAGDMKRYFNSGVLLMNLKFMRQENFSEKVRKALKEEFFVFPDQDCLNFICHDKVKIVSPEYNLIIVESVLRRHISSSITDYYKYQKQPAIVHFVMKPWKSPFDKIPYSELYWNYLKRTPYKKYAAWRYRLSCRAVRKWLFQVRFKRHFMVIRLFGVYILGR